MSRPLRVVVIFSGIVAGLALIAGPLLWSQSKQAIDANRQLVCGLSDFLSRSPISRLPDQTDAEFAHRVALYRDFLRDLNDQQTCGGDISARLRKRIEQAERLVHRNRPEGGGALQPGSNPGQQPGPGEPAPPPHHPKPAPPDCDIEVTDLVCQDVPPLPGGN